MSRTIRGSKGCGYDYGSKRPGNKGYAQGPGSSGGAYIKKCTHKTERAQGKASIRKETE